MGRWGEGTGKGIFTQLVGWLLDIEDDSFDVLGREMMNEKLSNAIASSGNDDELLLPVPAIPLPVVQRALTQEAIDPARNAPVETCSQAL